MDRETPKDTYTHSHADTQTRTHTHASKHASIPSSSSLFLTDKGFSSQLSELAHEGLTAAQCLYHRDFTSSHLEWLHTILQCQMYASYVKQQRGMFQTNSFLLHYGSAARHHRRNHTGAKSPLFHAPYYDLITLIQTRQIIIHSICLYGQ